MQAMIRAGYPYLPAELVTKLLEMPVRWDANRNRLHIDCQEGADGTSLEQVTPWDGAVVAWAAQ